ncbi:MAG: PIN domain protein [Cryomorphaceae bacterium]|nr:PIN domain protein [Flavobacteriales bacterium]
MIKSAYLDTSVFGGYYDVEFSANTIPFFDRVLEERIQIFVSRLLIAELAGAPDEVRELLNRIPAEQQKPVTLDDEARNLANKYIEENVVGKTSKADCQHIAMATLAKADVLVSWNFKHIVNLDRIRGYNGVNLLLGYSPIEIRTPKEIERYD